MGATAASLLPASAVTPAEAFIADNIQKGLIILNDRQLSEDDRANQFQQLLLGLTNTKRIAAFTLGQYVRTAPQADRDEFAAAFQDYSIAVYRSYLAKYAGQSLKVTGSSQRAPDDFIVNTVMVDPNDRSGQRPLEVDFRVRTDAGRPELIDISVLGIWLALSQRDQFVAFLAQNRGDVKALTAHMRQTAAQYR
ncbi:MAG: ABC transporter substrate-binding protein [Proteobacteria bacterium]|nr:ABC transporter substrate-binding protein [Pseudomonadota bacterium]